MEPLIPYCGFLAAEVVMCDMWRQLAGWPEAVSVSLEKLGEEAWSGWEHVCGGCTWIRRFEIPGSRFQMPVSQLQIPRLSIVLFVLGRGRGRIK